MTKREIAFLLIGLGFGLMFAEVVIFKVLVSLYRMKFIVAYAWDWVILVVPALLLLAGMVLILYRSKSTRISN